MSDELLMKEKELHQLNEELKLKTRHVLEEINCITNRPVRVGLSRQENRAQDITTIGRKNSKPSLVSYDELTKKSNLLKKSLEKLQNQNEKSIETDDAILCEGTSLENKALIDFLKTKINILHDELRVIQFEYKSKDDYCQKLESENKKLDYSKLKLYNQLEVLKEMIAKLENNNTDLHGQNLALNAENLNLRKDMEDLKREMKMLNHQLNNYDLRLNRSLEENEKLKNAIKFDHLEEKELRDQIRKLKEDKKQEIKHLEKQRLDLYRAFKKQQLLIDNLKKQNAFMIAFERIQLVEKDFSKLLSWKPSNLQEIK